MRIKYDFCGEKGEILCEIRGGRHVAGAMIGGRKREMQRVRVDK